MGRIEENEKRLDKLIGLSKKLEEVLNDFNNSINDYYLLNKYYGSNKWFKDKKDFETGKIKNIKAGVLSEDAIWNLDEDIRDNLSKMQEVISKFEKKN